MGFRSCTPLYRSNERHFRLRGSIVVYLTMRLRIAPPHALCEIRDRLCILDAQLFQMNEHLVNGFACRLLDCVAWRTAGFKAFTDNAD